MNKKLYGITIYISHVSFLHLAQMDFKCTDMIN